MSVEILHDPDKQIACFYCNTTDVAFGPVFYGHDAGHNMWLLLGWFHRRGAALYARDLGWQPLFGDGSDPREWTRDQLVTLATTWWEIQENRAKRKQGFRCVPDESGGLAG
jgi:hypothetical protein